MTTSSHKFADMQSKFEKLNLLGQGSFGKVYLARSILKNPKNYDVSANQNSNHLNISSSNTNNSSQNTKNKSEEAEYYALKKLKRHPRKKYLNIEDDNIDSYPQIQVMSELKHPNLMSLHEIVQNDKGYEMNHLIVMDFGIELLYFAKQKEIAISKEVLKYMIYQIVEGLAFMHQSGYIHRDVKPSNIYVMADGTIRLGDFSISRKMPIKIENSIPAQQHSSQEIENIGKMSPNMTTRYYRAPEIIFGDRYYDQSIDAWGLGCTLAQLILHQPLFPGETDINQLEIIFGIVGYPQKLWPDASLLPYYLEFNDQVNPKGLDSILPDVDKDLLKLIQELLELDPKKRLKMLQIKKHAYFSSIKKESISEFKKIAAYLHEKRMKEVLKLSK